MASSVEKQYGTLSERIEAWIEEFKDSPSVKALSAAFQGFSYLKAAYDIFKGIFFPDPNYDALILEALAELRRDIHDLFTDLANSRAEALVENFQAFSSTHNPDLLDELLSDAIYIKSELRTIISKWDPRDGYKVAEMYNVVVPLYSTIYLQFAAHSQEQGNNPDWAQVHLDINASFNEAIKINQCLLGPYVFEDLPNIPCYELRKGKLHEAFTSKHINYDQFLYIVELLWQSNERLREETIPDYSKSYIWFSIERAGSGPDLSPCIMAFPKEQFSTKLFVGVFSEKDTPTSVWRLQYKRHDAVQLFHRCGKAITVARIDMHPCLGPNAATGPDVFLLPPSIGGEYDYATFVHETNGLCQYIRSWRDAEWRREQIFGTRIESAPAVFQNFATDALYNFEVFVQEYNRIRHYWRAWQNGNWYKGEAFGENVLGSAPAAFQNQENYNYEVFVRENDQLQHYSRDFNNGKWCKGERIGTFVYSGPAAFQVFRSLCSDLNFEVFVRQHGHIRRYWARWEFNSEYEFQFRWHEGETVGAGVLSGPAAFQNLVSYNYELFVREGSQIQHYWRGWRDGAWHKGNRIGRDVQSGPAAFQNQFNYNYEVFVREGDHIQHYWRSWRDGSWNKGQQFSAQVQLGAGACQNPDYRDGQIWQVLDAGWDMANPHRVPRVAVQLKLEHRWFFRFSKTGLQPGIKSPFQGVPEHVMDIQFRPRDKTKKDRQIALRASNGQYLCAEGGGGRELVANRTSAGAWESFGLVDLANAKVALRTEKGFYWSAERGGGREVVANRNCICAWESFDLVELGGNKIALRSDNGQYLCAEAGGGAKIVANRSFIGAWESFELIELCLEK